jgi:hypothetical protein
MTVPRPLSRELLKKMFLKVLYVNKYSGNNFSYCSSDFVSILCGSMAEYFRIPELSEEEYGECLAAVYELERDGYLTQDDNYASKRFKDLTEKGKTYVTEKLAELKLPSVEIEQYITRDDLREHVLEDYLSGEYENSIKKAFSLIENLLISRKTQISRMIDSSLMSRTYISSEGKLRYSDSEVESELESLQRIMRGTMIWFRDPRTSKTFGMNDAEAAAQILVFANLHLNILDQ